MVRPGESSVTQLAVEGFVPGVLSLVPCQLITASEPPAAVFPTADVGLLPGVGPQVSLQVRRLGVLLAATRVLAGVGWSLTLQHDHHLCLIARLLEHLGELVRGKLLVQIVTRGGGGR